MATTGENSGEAATVLVRYFAGARAAAGRTEETVAMPAGATVSDLISELGGRHGERLTKVLPSCSYLLDGIAVRDTGLALSDGIGVDVLPPFAGG